MLSQSARIVHAPVTHEQEDSLPLPLVHELRRDDPHESKYPASGGDVAPAAARTPFLPSLKRTTDTASLNNAFFRLLGNKTGAIDSVGDHQRTSIAYHIVKKSKMSPTISSLLETIRCTFVACP